MNDLLTEPFIVIPRGNQKLYKFKNGRDLYSEDEFKALLRKNIEETCYNEVNEVKRKARKVNRKDNTTKHSAD